MFVSARQMFREGDANWDRYLSWIGLKNIQEVRSLDRHINFILPNTDMCDCILGDYQSALRRLPKIDSSRQYCQLAINLSYEMPPTWVQTATFLGCDLADGCWRSGVLNYGPWPPELARIALHINQYGLLRVSDARAAKQLMATQWDRAFSHVYFSIWGIYELTIDSILSAETSIPDNIASTTQGEARDIQID